MTTDRIPTDQDLIALARRAVGACEVAEVELAMTCKRQLMVWTFAVLASTAAALLTMIGGGWFGGLVPWAALGMYWVWSRRWHALRETIR